MQYCVHVYIYTEYLIITAFNWMKHLTGIDITHFPINCFLSISGLCFTMFEQNYTRADGITIHKLNFIYSNIDTIHDQQNKLNFQNQITPK